MSKTTVSWLQRKLPKGWTFDSRGDWPPNSPDLNPIENVWAILKDKVYEKQPKNETELAEVIEVYPFVVSQKKSSSYHVASMGDLSISNS